MTVTAVNFTCLARTGCQVWTWLKQKIWEPVAHVKRTLLLFLAYVHSLVLINQYLIMPETGTSCPLVH